MLREVLTLSAMLISVASVLNCGQAEQHFYDDNQIGPSVYLKRVGKDRATSLKSPLGTMYNTKTTWRTSDPDSGELNSTNLANDDSDTPNGDSVEAGQSSTAIGDTSPDIGKDMTHVNASGADKTIPTNQSNVDPSAPSPLKSMYIATTKPGLGSPLTQPVFKENAFVGLFNSCSKVQINESIGPIGADTCFEDDEYNDRITFEMTYLISSEVIENAFHTTPPKLLVQDGVDQIAEPRIFITDVSKADSMAKVVVLYNCKAGSSGSVHLSLHLSFGDSENSSLSIPWTKTCSTGENDKISFGYISEKDSTSSKVDFNKSEASALVVAPSDVSTEVYLKLQQPGAQQVFLAPYVTSSKPEVTEVLVRGNHPSGGVLKGLEETSFQISYNCEQKGSTEIHVSVAFPPFDNVTASWIKDCGGQTPSSLQVGTELGSSDVVSNGEPTQSFMVGIQHIGTEHSDEHLHLSGNQSDWKVFLQNSGIDFQSSEAALHIGRIALTVEHPGTIAVLEPRIRSKSALGWSVTSNSGYALGPGSSLEYETVEFGIAKRCTHLGRVRKSRQLVFTAGKAFASLIAICVAAVVVIVRRRSFASKGFEALPTTDR